jgi:hypothetical protein
MLTSQQADATHVSNTKENRPMLVLEYKLVLALLKHLGIHLGLCSIKKQSAYRDDNNVKDKKQGAIMWF